MACRVERAVEGPTGYIDGYEFYYPYALNEENLDAVGAALGDEEIYILANSLHPDPQFKNGGMTSSDKVTRQEALRRTLACVDLAGSVGAHVVMWPGNEGYNYPFQIDYARSWGLLIDSLTQAAERCQSYGDPDVPRS